MELLPRIELLPEKKLAGQQLEMTFNEDKTFQLWHRFMPRRKEITNKLNEDLFAIQVYGPTVSFETFNPDDPFVKWATVEVPDFDSIPEGMEPFTLPGGLYAVFIHKGTGAEASKTFGYIFRTWLPASEYVADQRPHFEILGEKYKRDDPSSEEEVWIPIKSKIR
jgi:AraC family transcriptional regulator